MQIYIAIPRIFVAFHLLLGASCLIYIVHGCILHRGKLIRVDMFCGELINLDITTSK